MQKVYNGKITLFINIYIITLLSKLSKKKASLFISAVVLSLYRWSITKQLLKDFPYTKIPFAFIIVSTIQISTNFIISIVAVNNATLIQITTSRVHSLPFIQISFTIQYIIYNYSSTKGNNYSRSSYLYNNITIIVIKITITTSVACASQDIMYLYTHYILEDLYYFLFIFHLWYLVWIIYSFFPLQ